VIEAHFGPRSDGTWTRVERLVDGDVLEIPGIPALAVSDLVP
jgi:hypothetical protein